MLFVFYFLFLGENNFGISNDKLPQIADKQSDDKEKKPFKQGILVLFQCSDDQENTDRKLEGRRRGLYG